MAESANENRPGSSANRKSGWPLSVVVAGVCGQDCETPAFVPWRRRGLGDAFEPRGVSSSIVSIRREMTICA